MVKKARKHLCSEEKRLLEAFLNDSVKYCKSCNISWHLRGCELVKCLYLDYILTSPDAYEWWIWPNMVHAHLFGQPLVRPLHLLRSLYIIDVRKAVTVFLNVGNQNSRALFMCLWWWVWIYLHLLPYVSNSKDGLVLKLPYFVLINPSKSLLEW